MGDSTLSRRVEKLKAQQAERIRLAGEYARMTQAVIDREQRRIDSLEAQLVTDRPALRAV